MLHRNAISLTLAVAVGLAWMSAENQVVTAFVAPSSASIRTTTSWKTTDSFPIISTATCLTPPATLPTSTSTSSRISRTTAPSSSSLQALPAALTALPLSQKMFLSCFLPTCLGFWRSEYGVSYAYGAATALTSYWIYQALIQPSKACIMTNLATWHAGALIFYGVRLCLFLLYRELCTQRMKDSVKRIEAKATARGSRLKRTPFVVSCAGLYFGLCAPLLLTSRLVSVTDINKWVVLAMKTLVSMIWGGFLFAALGDFNKSIVKAIKGEDHLVTGGLFKLCRHPNYTGEIFGWTANGSLAVLSAIVIAMWQTQSQSPKGKVAKIMLLSVPKLAGYTAASIMGALGLDFVLVQATGGLEKRQKETYGESKVYQEWVDNTWPGFETPATVEEVVDPHVHPEIEVVDTPDEGGSGI